MDHAVLDVDEALVVGGNDFDLPGFQPGGKARAPVEFRFGGLAVVFKRLVGLGVQVDLKLRGERQGGGEGQKGQNRKRSH